MIEMTILYNLQSFYFYLVTSGVIRMTSKVTKVVVSQLSIYKQNDSMHSIVRLHNKGRIF